MGKFKLRRIYKTNLTDQGVNLKTILQLLDRDNPLLRTNRKVESG